MMTEVREQRISSVEANLPQIFGLPVSKSVAKKAKKGDEPTVFPFSSSAGVAPYPIPVIHLLTHALTFAGV